jgi:hypothetical protein
MNNPTVTEALNQQVLRGEVLRFTGYAEPRGAGVEVLQAFIKKNGFTVGKDEILTICRYLEGKGLVAVEHIENKILGVSRDVAHITPKGVDVMEGTETIEGIELVD